MADHFAGNWRDSYGHDAAVIETRKYVRR